MTACLFPAMCVSICLTAVLLLRSYTGVEDFFRRLRKISFGLLSFSLVVGAAVAAFLANFSYVSEYFTSALSADFIAGSRAALRLLFGTESVFASLQMLGAMSLFLFSVATCAVFIYCAYFVLFRHGVCLTNVKDDCSDKRARVCIFAFGRRFAWLSRYLI